MEAQTQARPVTKKDIGRLLGRHILNRGMKLVRRRKVLSAVYDDDGWVRAVLEAGTGRTHSVEVRPECSNGSGLSGVEGTCTCLGEATCVHMVAALLAALEQINAVAAVRPRPLPKDVQVWLDDIPLHSRQGNGNPGRQGGSLEVGRHHVFYVVHQDEFGECTITPCKAYLKKDRTIGHHTWRPRVANPSFPPDHVTPTDVGLMAQLLACRSSATGSRWPRGEEMLSLLKSVVTTGRAKYMDLHGTTLSWGDPRPLALKWLVTDTGKQALTADLPNGAHTKCLHFSVPFYLDIDSGTVGPMESDLDPSTLSWLTSAPPMPPAAAEAVAEKLQVFGDSIPKPPAMQVMHRRGLKPVPVVKLFTVEEERPWSYGDWRWNSTGHGDHYFQRARIACARLEFEYPEVKRRVRFGAGEDPCRVDGRNLLVVQRDEQLEDSMFKAFVELAMRYDADFAEHEDCDLEFGEINGRNDGFDAPGFDFTAMAVPELRRYGWKVEVDDSWPVRIHDDSPAISTGIESSETDWFALSLRIEVEGQSLDVAPNLVSIINSVSFDDFDNLLDDDDILERIRRQDVFVELPDGSHVRFGPDVLAPIAEAMLEAHGLLGFHSAEIGSAVAVAEALEGCGIAWDKGRELRELGNRLRQLVENPVATPPESITGTLRPYQQAGYGWFRVLADSGFGGVLADDMGLGKTLQALSLLAHRHLEVGSDRPSLAVIPTSLIGNWKREANKFAPDLKLLVLHGPDRKQHFSRIPDCHLAITTYPLVNRDHEELFRHEYEVALLDEAQNAKNPAAAIARNIRRIDARTRIALTGTPMENNLQELWAIFDWLIPGMLGNRKSFGEKYRRPIEKHGDSTAQYLLTSRLRPFMLRRTKEEVAGELPPKTVIDEITPLEGPQRALYEGIRVAMDRRVKQAIQAKGLASSRITILDALLKLRQVCCDPALVRMQAASKVQGSAKRKRLLELLEELTAENRKVLVFSQFVRMLKLIEGDVIDRGWDYSMLHGQTRDRDRQIDRFQNGRTPLFLISLKAGGVGLNLTAADTVIIYDPWWNPATERQAMDRAHRIGQDKPVFVHRMIAEGTVETVIQEMQAKKQSLADALFEGKGSGPLNLSEGDLNALFGG